MIRFVQKDLDVPRATVTQFDFHRHDVARKIRDTPLPNSPLNREQGPVGRPEHRDFTGNTLMDIYAARFDYEVTTVLPTVPPIGRRGPMYADPVYVFEGAPIIATTSTEDAGVAAAPADYHSDDIDPSDTYVPPPPPPAPAMMAQAVPEFDEEISSEDYDEEEAPPYTIEFQDGGARKRSLTAPKSRTARLTTSALLREALWGAGSLKRPARTSLHSIFPGRVAKRRKIDVVTEPDYEEE
ncbi:hypothetical protein GL218_02593 [Daldinia childiae]|uniref:uncharacterized protein n=1 Tax=Daldinia childiae TaxID=326645 RepID=UPI0014466E88|nr:uncharacterized protein GL218_02593 [Daldinia childiae]KAF3064818.1 hypothetical protein GL218_02593 [Daldinia childiae]